MSVTLEDFEALKAEHEALKAEHKELLKRLPERKAKRNTDPVK